MGIRLGLLYVVYLGWKKGAFYICHSDRPLRAACNLDIRSFELAVSLTGQAAGHCNALQGAMRSTT